MEVVVSLVKDNLARCVWWASRKQARTSICAFAVAKVMRNRMRVPASMTGFDLSSLETHAFKSWSNTKFSGNLCCFRFRYTRQWGSISHAPFCWCGVVTYTLGATHCERAIAGKEAHLETGAATH